jgi:hypothetical protein
MPSTVSHDMTFDDSTGSFAYSGLWSTVEGSQYVFSILALLCWTHIHLARPLVKVHRQISASKVSTISESQRDLYLTISPGNAIALHGTTDVGHGIFSVSLDDAAPLILNGSAPTTRPDTLLVC